MENTGNSSDNNSIKELQSAIYSLENRVKILEERLNIKSEAIPPVATKAVAAKEDLKVDWENLTGASQLGWLAIMVSLIGIGFFIRFMFIQDWITGMGQPVVLFLAGIILAAASDRLYTRGFTKFSAFLTGCGYITLFLSFYWASVRLGQVSPSLMVFAPLSIWIISVAWGFHRKSSLWPIWGFLGAGIIPLIVLKYQLFGDYFAVYCSILIIASIIVSIKKNWHWFPAIGSFAGHIIILITVRHFFEFSQNSISLTTGVIATIPGMLVLWSGLVHILNKRNPKIIELIAWFANNLILYAGIKNLWGKLDAPFLLLIPLACNGILYFLFMRSARESKYNLAYLIGLVISSSIALSILMPVPFDIISICLLSLFLAYMGDRKKEWDFKGLSGVIVVWSLIFLFSFRFAFSAEGEIPFLNFRFISFAVAFLCFGFQGKMINNDPSAGKIGPLLGQGLFSLGLLVLLSGISGEFMHLFPPEETKLFSDRSLLAISIVIAAFAFIVTYIGLALRLFFIRLLALAMFIFLISKMLFLDLLILRPSFLIISLAVVGILLGGTSILLKRHKAKKAARGQAANQQG